MLIYFLSLSDAGRGPIYQIRTRKRQICANTPYPILKPQGLKSTSGNVQSMRSNIHGHVQICRQGLQNHNPGKGCTIRATHTTHLSPHTQETITNEPFDTRLDRENIQHSDRRESKINDRPILAIERDDEQNHRNVLTNEPKTG